MYLHREVIFQLLDRMITSDAVGTRDMKCGTVISKSGIQHRISFHQQIGLKFKEETSKVLHLERSCVKGKGKAVPLQAWTGPEGSRKLRLPDFVTTAQDGGRFSALRTCRLYPQYLLLVLTSVRG